MLQRNKLAGLFVINSSNWNLLNSSNWNLLYSSMRHFTNSRKLSIPSRARVTPEAKSQMKKTMEENISIASAYRFFLSPKSFSNQKIRKGQRFMPSEGKPKFFQMSFASCVTLALHNVSSINRTKISRNNSYQETPNKECFTHKITI